MAAAVHILTHEFTPFRGGIGIYVEETARVLARMGIQTKVWAPGYDGENKDDFSFAVQRISMRGKQDWICRWKMARAIKKAFPGGIIPGTLILAEPGPIRLWMYHKWLGLPRPERLVLVLHGSEQRMLTQSRRRKRLFGRLINCADCIGVVSGAVQREFLENYPEVVSKLAIVPGGVRTEWSGLPPTALPMGDGVQEILQVGRIDPRKGQLTLIEAVEQLPATLRQTVRVRLIGPVGRKAYADAIRERIRSSNLPVSMEGALPAEVLRAAYESASLVVMPSEPFNSSIEGLGLALVEAQHFGRPVVGSRFGGIPEALVENESGLLVPPGDPRELSTAITSILMNPEGARKMGESGAGFVRRCFSWEKNARLLCGLTTDEEG